MNESHNISDAERDLIGFAVKRLRDECNQTLNWLYPPAPLKVVDEPAQAEAS